jgi:3-hydroxy-9,10-secoandrosta-1,3,5(10)-triene-9,17-dione monooxygenase
MNAPFAPGLAAAQTGAQIGEQTGRQTGAPAIQRSADFSSCTLSEALDRARALVDTLRARSAATEALRRPLPETIADLHASGLLRCVQPRRWGGMELDFDSLVRVPAELARGCASTAWVLGNWAIHHWMLALYSERAQSEVWDADPDALIASGIAYPQGRAHRVDGGVVLSGCWNFSSGVDPSPWNMLAAIVRDGERAVDYLICLVPASDYTIIDDWKVLGMAGTGSKSVKVEELFVPEHRALSMLLARGGRDFPGAVLHPNPLYSVSLASMGTHCLVGVAIGNAQAALEHTTAMVSQRVSSYQQLGLRDLPTVHQRLAGAAARIDAARALVLDDCARAQAAASEGRMPEIEEKLRPKRNVAYAAQLCTEAVDSLHTLAGANGIYDHGPMQRIFRDAHALTGHFGFSWDAHALAWGAVCAGAAYKAPATL